MSCRHEPPRPHQRAQGACGARRPGLQARARPAPRQPPPAPAGSPIRPEHDSTRRWSPRRLPSSAPGALRCPWHRSMSGSRRSPAPPPPSPPARPARRPRSGAPQRPNLTVIVAAGGRAVLKFGAGCATTVRARGQLIGGEGGGWEQPGPEYSGACYFLGRSGTADRRPRGLSKSAAIDEGPKLRICRQSESWHQSGPPRSGPRRASCPLKHIYTSSTWCRVVRRLQRRSARRRYSSRAEQIARAL